MKDILTAPFVREMCETTANMYRLGWDERNGGNISYLLKEEEVAKYLDLSKVERREVTLGGGDEDYVAITSGLEEGEMVLVPVQSSGGLGSAATAATGG